MNALDGRGWQLSRRVTDLLKAETALTQADLAEKLKVSEADLKAPIGMLIGRGVLERCGDYLTVSLADEGKS